MPTLEYETQISGYVSGYTVTVAIDSAQVLTDMGLPYDHIELQTSGGVTVQSSSSTSVVVTDTSCIFQDIYSNWVVGYALYCDDSGTPVRQFYSSSPNAISASAAQKSVVAVVQLQDGSKASIGLSAVTTGDKVVVIPLQDGTKVVKKLEKYYTGDKVVVMPLQDGSKVAVHLLSSKTYLSQSEYTSPYSGYGSGAPPITWDTDYPGGSPINYGDLNSPEFGFTTPSSYGSPNGFGIGSSFIINCDLSKVVSVIYSCDAYDLVGSVSYSNGYIEVFSYTDTFITLSGSSFLYNFTEDMINYIRSYGGSSLGLSIGIGNIVQNGNENKTGRIYLTNQLLTVVYMGL